MARSPALTSPEDTESVTEEKLIKESGGDGQGGDQRCCSGGQARGGFRRSGRGGRASSWAAPAQLGVSSPAWSFPTVLAEVEGEYKSKCCGCLSRSRDFCCLFLGFVFIGFGLGVFYLFWGWLYFFLHLPRPTRLSSPVLPNHAGPGPPPPGPSSLRPHGPSFLSPVTF